MIEVVGECLGDSDSLADWVPLVVAGEGCGLRPGLIVAQNGRAVGVRTVVGKSWECMWTLTLKAGQITVEGPFMDEGDSLFAVTGGTGKYAGAGGQMTLHARDAKGTEYDFRFSLMH